MSDMSFHLDLLSFLIVLSAGIYNLYFLCFLLWLIAGELARQVYENMRREASCLRIQRDYRMHLARKVYNELCSSAVSIQTGMRGMTARNELRFRRQTKAAIIIQVNLRIWENH